MKSKLSTRAVGSSGSKRWWQWLIVGGGLSIGLAVGAVVLMSVTSRSASVDPSAPPSTPLFDAVGHAIGALGSSEPEFLAARDQLLSALEQRRQDVAPETLETVDLNLGVVDGAIVEVARALEKDPDNPRLTRLLAAACRKELELLRRAATLPGDS
jgi:hypothetical protein